MLLDAAPGTTPNPPDDLISSKTPHVVLPAAAQHPGVGGAGEQFPLATGRALALLQLVRRALNP